MNSGVIVKIHGGVIGDIDSKREQELAQLIKETSLVKIPCHKVSVMDKKQKG